MVDEVELAAYEPDSGYGDGAGVASDFLSAARELGVSYFPRTEVTGIRTSSGAVRGVSTSSGDIDAAVVVVATGPWSGHLFDGIGYRIAD